MMTSNCSELREALSDLFPTSNLLLCSFPIFQHVCRWLFDKKHGNSANDRVEIMCFFRQILHTREIATFDELVTNFFQFSSLIKYPSVTLYFTELGKSLAELIKISNP